MSIVILYNVLLWFCIGGALTNLTITSAKTVILPPHQRVMAIFLLMAVAPAVATVALIVRLFNILGGASSNK